MRRENRKKMECRLRFISLKYAIYYLPADVEEVAMFKPRVPLSEIARRAGWRGFLYDFKGSAQLLVRLRRAANWCGNTRDISIKRHLK
ncbi:hypothetical protein [Bradyrhizobium erythrophlei]|uniref:hypothetical protein n=1 Tax=Bradyrhizobium erythrophlei TaxID=1437360 RepID=UPI0018D2E6C8|nr:hypothetical protein [Bradyrhizobium erythrophlei]